MAAGKHAAWHGAAKLEEITNWAAKGCTDAELAENIGINRTTLYEWLNKYPDIADAIKRGRELSIACIENMAFKVAMGQAEEETGVKVRNADGSERVEMRKRKLAPNTAMLIFLLKNRAGYRDNPPENVDAVGTLEKARELLAGVPSAID